MVTDASRSNWTPKEISHLGTKPDAELAAILGRSVESVSLKRQKLGIEAPRGGYIVLRNFTGREGDGASPLGGVIEASDGALYGTTETGGSSILGTIFKLNKDGSGYAVLYSFSKTGGDGQRPF